jgi:hypothetical protein
MIQQSTLSFGVLLNVCTDRGRLSISIMQLTILRLGDVPSFLLLEDLAASLLMDALAGGLVFRSFRMHGPGACARLVTL